MLSNTAPPTSLQPPQYSAFKRLNAIGEMDRNSLVPPANMSYLNGAVDLYMTSLNQCFPLKSNNLKVDNNQSLVTSSYGGSSFPYTPTSMPGALFRPYGIMSGQPSPLFGHRLSHTAEYLKELERGSELLRSPVYPGERENTMTPSSERERPSSTHDNHSNSIVSSTIKHEMNNLSRQSSPSCRASSRSSLSPSSTVRSPHPSVEDSIPDSAPAQVSSSLTDPSYPGYFPPGVFPPLGRVLPQPTTPFLPSPSSLFMYRPELAHLTSPGLGAPLYMNPSGNTGVIHPTLLTLGAAMGMSRRNDPTKPPPVKKYKCDVCGKAFSRSNTLVTHKRIHTGDKPFKCELCGRAFRQPGNLTRHRLTHTTVKPYVCPQCNKAFNRASNLHTHMRTHTNYKPFVCQFCGKGFHQKIDMKIHSYTHTGEKPHKCKMCGRGFKQLTHLTYHMRTHSDEKVYSCETCGKGFNQKGNLQAHIYGHTGERPHKCDICGKGFTLASTLNTHRRTHAEKKPFVCQYCGKDFYQKNALKSHLVASHPYTANTLLL